MVGDRLEYLVLNSEGGESYNKNEPMYDERQRGSFADGQRSCLRDGATLYIHPETLVLYEADTDTLDTDILDLCEVYVEYDVYPNYTYRPAFSSMRAFKDFQLTRNVNDVVHMFIFCQFAKIWTFSVAR